MLYLLASCIALLLAPIFYRFFSADHGLQKGLDGFIFVSLGGLVLLHILPEQLEHGGFLAIIFVILGMWGPTASEKLFHRYSEITHNLTLTLGVAGLLLHTLTDGSAMVFAQQAEGSMLLILGIILHRLPVGLAIWWLVKPHIGSRWAMAVLATMIIFTCIGYFAGEQLLAQLSMNNTVYLQAFVTGSILHVVLHQPHSHQSQNEAGKGSQQRYEYHAGIGSLLGIGLLFLLLMMDSGGHQHDHHGHSTEQLVDWVMALAPVLLLSYAVAGIRFKLGLSPQNSHLGKRWLQRLAGPEALIITTFLLGPLIALFQLISLLLIGALLTFNRIEPTDPHLSIPKSPFRFGFAHIVDRSAPWILLSLVLANLIGHPSVPLENPLIQVVVLMVLFLPMRFCNLGGAVLALSLAYSGWSIPAVMLALVAAPIFNLAQLKLMSWTQRAGIIGLIIVLLAITSLLQPQWTMMMMPESLSMISLIILACLFAASLLRLGPRMFMARIILLKTKDHSHKHRH
ncbi:MAG: metal transporter [Shewanella sp.]